MKILYICTHNRCRSILSEAISNQASKGAITARSAGSQPAGQVHPLSIQYLSENAYSTDNLQSNSWDDFEGFAPDVVITVCDSAAAETCPAYFGNHLKIHWGLQDPSKVTGSAAEQELAFTTCIKVIEKRVSALTHIANQNLNKQDMKTALNHLLSS